MRAEMLKDFFGINRIYTGNKSKKDLFLLRKKIYQYFLRDDISRAPAGKKETVTRNKKKI